MDKHHIERRARELLGEVIKHQATIFNDGLPRDRFDLLTPEAAAAVCGVSLHRAGKLDAVQRCRRALVSHGGAVGP